MQGKIIKGIAGFYYVYTAEAGIFECKAKGIFRKEKIKPLVGDHVEMEAISQEEKTGNIVRILERKNELIRPAVANIDQALVIFSADRPKPNFNLLDRFLVMMEQQQVETVICFNKQDLAEEEELARLRGIYEGCGYEVLVVSAKKEQGIEELLGVLDQKTTTVAGPSGVGKSSIINLLQSKVQMETGDISEKIERGKHTTRHSQLIYIQDQTFIMDTPGFSSIYLTGIEQQNLQTYFREFKKYEPCCRFQGCSHTHEPDCSVKQALEEGVLSPVRYEDYVMFYEELKNVRKY
ncbi:ribosome small subunit-dependent GTPase A [Petralouisia muris]|jgi:ribosome biogenesis GTPase|uniref:Ribosome small subunit-dependent GTPase A n=1 Tax=Petralouisia muris TaxID=3032872 RepID=A0AC61S2N2_9FIRM|nr:ribosome small subunit-dependent GTPase A [Petralouisia muris]TGY98310.1 ribosome small subunit-dependent GTPase A [Petralouisia muris]